MGRNNHKCAYAIITASKYMMQKLNELKVEIDKSTIAVFMYLLLHTYSAVRKMRFKISLDIFR